MKDEDYARHPAAWAESALSVHLQDSRSGELVQLLKLANHLGEGPYLMSILQCKHKESVC
jgi:hypothetical protein